MSNYVFPLGIIHQDKYIFHRMKLVGNLIKGLILVALIFGVLYFGLSYYLKQEKPAAVSETVPSKTTEDLVLLHDELSRLELKIQDLRKENKPFIDEEEAVTNIHQEIGRLEKERAKELPLGPAPASTLKDKMNIIPAEGFLSDPYQKVGLAVVGLFILLLFVFLVVRLLKKNPLPSPKRSSNARPGKTPNKANPQDAPLMNNPAKTGDAQLKETLERFKTASSVMRKGETREVSLEAVKKNNKPDPVPVDPMPFAKPEKVLEKSEQPVQSNAKDSGLVERVFEADRLGLSIEAISEKLHIDQDQVRLILRFKH